jgi:hypothetical protein
MVLFEGIAPPDLLPAPLLLFEDLGLSNFFLLASDYSGPLPYAAGISIFVTSIPINASI